MASYLSRCLDDMRNRRTLQSKHSKEVLRWVDDELGKSPHLHLHEPLQLVAVQDYVTQALFDSSRKIPWISYLTGFDESKAPLHLKWRRGLAEISHKVRDSKGWRDDVFISACKIHTFGKQSIRETVRRALQQDIVLFQGRHMTVYAPHVEDAWAHLLRSTIKKPYNSPEARDAVEGLRWISRHLGRPMKASEAKSYMCNPYGYNWANIDVDMELELINRLYKAKYRQDGILLDKPTHPPDEERPGAKRNFKRTYNQERRREPKRDPWNRKKKVVPLDPFRSPDRK